MNKITQYNYPKGSGVGDFHYALVTHHTDDLVKVVTYLDGSIKTIRVICEHDTEETK